MDPTTRRRNNYLPELPPLQCALQKPARISTPAVAVDPPELRQPHRHRSFLNQRHSENLYLSARIRDCLSGISQDRSFRDTHQKNMQFFFPFLSYYHTRLWISSSTIAIPKNKNKKNFSLCLLSLKLFFLFSLKGKKREFFWGLN